MGGDGTDLFIAVEDAFQIHFTDEEARDAYTVGALYDLVVAKLDGPCSKRCLTSWAFYRTRRGIVETLGIDRRQIRPATPLEDLLPRDGRRENWRRMIPRWSGPLSAIQAGARDNSRRNSNKRRGLCKNQTATEKSTRSKGGP